MSVDSLIFWLFVAAWAVVFGLIAFVQAPRIFGELRRIIRRLLDLVDNSPLPLQLAKAEADAARIEVALARFPAIERRLHDALQRLRRTSLVTPSLADGIAVLKREVDALRRVWR